jgi:hypothetical protein
MRFVIRGILIAILMSMPAWAQVDVLTRRMDNARSAVNSRETALNPRTVRAKFGKLWSLYADAKIMAQPLYVSNLIVPASDAFGTVAKAKCPSGCNVVIFATMKGTLYAYLADEKPQATNDTLVWARYLSDNSACQCGATGPQNGSGDFDMWAVDDPWWGIVGTPVIDRATNSLYVVAWTNDQQYRLYNLNLKNGQIQKGPVLVQGSVGGQNVAANTPGWTQLRKQRASLLLSNALLYVPFGGDNPDSLAGWLFVYDAATLTLKAVWSPTPAGRNGGIWMGGEGAAVDAEGNIFLQVGDGDLDVRKSNYGDTLLKLQFRNGALNVVDYFSPCNQMLLQRCDLDQGSSGPILFHDLVAGGGKNGWIYVMRAAKLAKYMPGPYPPSALVCDPGVIDCTDSADLVQKWRATHGHIHGSPVFWDGPAGKSWLYVMGEGDHLKAFPFEDGRFNLAGVKQGKWVQPPLTAVPECQSQANHGMWMPGGYLAVSSDASKAGTGILWALLPANGDSNSCRGVKGMLMAFDAEDVSKEIWRSQAQDAAVSDTADSFGLLARFNTMTIANGKVFVPTAGDAEPLRRVGEPRPVGGPANYRLVVYGLKQ